MTETGLNVMAALAIMGLSSIVRNLINVTLRQATSHHRFLTVGRRVLREEGSMIRLRIIAAASILACSLVMAQSTDQAVLRLDPPLDTEGAANAKADRTS